MNRKQPALIMILLSTVLTIAGEISAFANGLSDKMGRAYRAGFYKSRGKIRRRPPNSNRRIRITA